jgi:hypothetical protein
MVRDIRKDNLKLIFRIHAATVKGSQKKEEKQYHQPENRLFALSDSGRHKRLAIHRTVQGAVIPVKSFETAAEVFGISGKFFFLSLIYICF